MTHGKGLNYQPVFTVVDSGQTVSEATHAGNGRLQSIWAPVVDSCQIFVRASFDSTSANFVRVIDTNIIDTGSNKGYDNPLRWDIAAGSEALILEQSIEGLPFIKIETSVAQTDVRTFVLLYDFMK